MLTVFYLGINMDDSNEIDKCWFQNKMEDIVWIKCLAVKLNNFDV
jgi:hypothetical protein